jgi:hypothetical protein
VTTVYKCDVCGKTAESSIAFASLEINAYRLSHIKDVLKEACSVACMAKLLRETANRMDPQGAEKADIEDTSESEDTPGLLARLFR